LAIAYVLAIFCGYETVFDTLGKSLFEILLIYSFRNRF
jgi:hypothetical protein